jgi:hypothetical protein
MLAAGKWALTIVPAGIALGALLGDAANPEMKDPPAQWWQLAGADEVAVAEGALLFEAGPDDLSPFGSYRPDLDYDAEVWAEPIPAYEMAALTDEPSALPGSLPTVTYGVAAEEVADAAEAAAEEAVAAAQPEPAPTDVRKSELASAGLY